MTAPKEVLDLVDTFEQNIYFTDRQIDNLVYELYGLTKEEISIVEDGQSK